MLARQPEIERFMRFVQPDPITGCWNWIGNCYPNGYGLFHVGNRRDNDRGTALAHRWLYEYHKGPIPDGLTLDHTCHNGSGCPGGPTCPHKKCVNYLEHLEPVTQWVNTFRGNERFRQEVLATHCHKGHLFDEDNLYVEKKPNGGESRHCRKCGAENARRYRKR